jgi:diacylglycerol kinase family enzyme
LSVLSSLAWSALNNNTSQNDNLACFRTKQIEVELEETQKLVVDGEILDTSKVTVSINPGALQVVTPIRLKP